MTRGRARRYLLTKQGYYPGVVASMGYDVWDWSTLNAGTLFQDSAKTTPASANGDVIGCWIDGVGGVDATQVTTANKPGLATGTLNGLQTLSFDGSDFLVTANISVTTFAIWVMVNRGTSAGKTIIANELLGFQLYIDPTQRLQIQVLKSALNSRKTTVATIAASTYQLFRHEYNGTHATNLLYADGASVSMSDSITNDPGTGADVKPLGIGGRTDGTFTFTGNMGQLLIMSPYPTDASILVNMSSYINNLWNGVY